MAPNPDLILTLTFSQTVDLLIEACALPEPSTSAVEARVKQLQRAGVPKMSGDGPVSRPRYGIAELAAFATAFRLMAAFMVPALAARYVTERWEELAPFLLAGGRETLPAEYLARRPLRSGSVAIFHGNALDSMGHRGRHDERYVSALGSLAFFEREGELLAAAQGAGLMLDSKTYMPIIISRFAEMTMASDMEMSSELDRLRFT